MNVRRPLLRPSPPPMSLHIFHGWKGLGRFWLGALSSFGAMAAILQVAGPPNRPVAPSTAPAASLTLPAPHTAPDTRPATPRVAILVAGIGMSMASSTAAIENLPPEVTLALSPYAPDPVQLLPAIKAHGHEYLLSLPMEPEGQPLNDADSARALMVSLPEEENLRRLRGVLGRVGGYAGVTSVAGGLRGERFLADPELFNTVLHTVAEKGLFLLDTGSHKPMPNNQVADIILDEAPLDAETLDRRLGRLSRLAHEKGSAIGVAGLPRPVVLDRIAAWSRMLTAEGVALAPVSALIAPSPSQQESAR